MSGRTARTRARADAGASTAGPDWPDAAWLQRCRAALLAWFGSSARRLPWRENRDPYRVWISEIMLQQTQVKQVMPYFERFLVRFPDVAALAVAPLDEVLKAWEGMGYYARARNLHRAAGRIMGEHSGVFPQEPEAVRALPGVGVYTAAAILSIAFGRPEVVVDGNVARVIARLAALPEEARSAAGRQKIAALAADFFDPGHPGDFNEAMMELGALICTPRSPACAACPVAECCAAQREGDPERYPVRRPSRAKPHHQIAAALIWRGRELLIARRREEGLLGGLWEFPGGKQAPGESLEETAVRETAEEVGLSIRVVAKFMSVEHAYTHFSITLHVFQSLWLSGEPACRACSDWRWITLEQLRDFAFPRANGRVIEALLTKNAGPPAI
ncbi:MAG TPA: A/G-specific adenine glycosylase [bacterium]|nr:A/G-specific adenine glycosylase [bacterium]HQG46831.1 A/G-specific adenine glycosylase [bacterium]HQI48994.1 A/G-specific adenine glycosylase [bacterium]HQJ65077.1 A/G-specific adenine glycosylase [bacterium]